MEIIRIGIEDAERIAPLVAAFRVQLKAYKGIRSRPNGEAGREEILEFINAGFPVFAAAEDGALAGYLAPCLWVEQLFVREECRRKGAASMLFAKAEELAASMGENTVYNYVHPNNEGMIRFLRAKGYTVLNLIEIRKAYEGEKLTAKIRVEKEVFDY